MFIILAMTEKKLEEIKLKYVNRNIEIYNNNKDIIKMYNEYITKIVEFFDFIMKNDSNLFYTIVFDVLVEIGFFSADRVFDPDKEEFQELLIKPGLSIINGAGVCRNVACFYEDVFAYFYNYPLKICCFDKFGEINKDTNIYGNHIINLTDYHDAIYGFDITNHCVFKPISYNELEGFNFDYLLEYVPNGDLLVELTTSLDKKSNFYNDVDIKCKLLELSSQKNTLNQEEYDKLIFEANDFIIQRKKIFQDFMTQNEELTHEIKKKMLSLK